MYTLPGQPTGIYETHVRRLFFDTVEDLDSLDAYQRRVNELALDAYMQASERISKTARWDEGYEGGDLHDDAVTETGLDPNDVVLHTGMMSLSRAVTLLDNVIAQAPTFLVPAEHRAEIDQYIYPNGQLWDTELADSFYWTCLANRMRPWRGHLKAIRELRNIYEHGYGYPRSRDDAEALASKVHRAVRGGAPADASETALGLHGTPEMFRHGISYTTKSGIQADIWQTLRFAIDPLATHRLIKVIRERAIEVIESVSHGFNESI
jgi:hypothetical protein